MSRLMGFLDAGTQAMNAGQLSTAVELLRQACGHSGPPSLMATARLTLASALRRSGDDDEAASLIGEAVVLDPTAPEAHYNLGNALLAQGRHEDAVHAFQQARALAPDFAKAANNEGAAWMALGRAEQAEACFEVATQLEPESGQAWANLGASRAAIGRHASPIHDLQRALRLDPGNQEVRAKLGHILTELGHLDAAERCFEGVLRQSPHHPSGRAGLAMARFRQGDAVGALAQIAPAVAMGRPSPDEAVVYAQVCMHMNQPSDAIEILQNCLAEAQEPATRVLLGKQLGQLLDATGQTDAAFQAIAEANRLRPLAFDAGAHAARIDTIIANYQRSAIRSAVLDEDAVFIVGMPRSGTTLIEQMLDCHSKIHGAGERGDLQQVAALMADPRMTIDDLNQLARAYLSRMRRLAPGACRVTDKMPDNFLYLGEAARLLPRARVIHCVRDPADTGLSVLFQNFKDTLPWATSERDIAQYITAYRRIMNHWADHLPIRMLTVPYEGLVSDPQTWAHRLASFLGLNFEPQMTHPENNPRTVRTASFDQVRRPIHTHSVGRSTSYRGHIPALMELQARPTDGPA